MAVEGTQWCEERERRGQTENTKARAMMGMVPEVAVPACGTRWRGNSTTWGAAVRHPDGTCPHPAQQALLGCQIGGTFGLRGEISQPGASREMAILSDVGWRGTQRCGGQCHHRGTLIEEALGMPIVANGNSKNFLPAARRDLVFRRLESEVSPRASQVRACGAAG